MASRKSLPAASLAVVASILATGCLGSTPGPSLPTPPPPAAASAGASTSSGAPPANPPASGNATGAPTAMQTPAAAPAAQDPVAARIADAESHFKSGQDELKQGRVARARSEFDRAIGILLDAPRGAKSDARLWATYEDLLSRIAALEATALRQGDGFSENQAEPAAIDALLAVATFPKATATTETTVATEMKTATYDLPVEQNDRVLSYVELFQNNLHSFLEEGITRGSQYIPRIKQIFAEEGVPLDLAYVPLIESAFKSTALSRAKAKGMWQFQLPTAGDYGLKFDWFIDERSDFEKSTLAAAKHFKMLAKMFDGDWNLALASYNVGQGKVLNAVKRAKTNDYWKLTESSKYLPKDTRAYVPMIWAAIIIAKNPSEFGFEITPLDPLSYDTVDVPDAIRLDAVADWAGVTVDDLRKLNPELRRLTTPMGPHTLRVPAGTKSDVAAKIAAADPAVFATFVRHTVKAGETLKSIARKYHISTQELAEANQMKTTARLKLREQLLVPSAIAPATTTSNSAPPAAAARSAVPGPSATAKATAPRTTVYTVRSGDTLYEIAQRYGVTVDQLKKWNNLHSSALKIGLKLKIQR